MYSLKTLKNELPISVVIVTDLRRSDHLGKCLQSLSEQKGKHAFEVIIVTDINQVFNINLWENKRFTIRFITVDENNYCLKRNVGAREARGRIIAYIDDDTIPESGWINAIMNGFKEDWKMAGGVVKPIFMRQIPMEIRGHEKYIGSFNFAPEIDYISNTIVGCNMFFKRCWLLKIGGFDEFIGRMNETKPRQFYGGDETDLNEKISQNQIGFIKDAVVAHIIHHDRINLKWILSRARGMGRGKHYIDSKYGIKRFHFKNLLYYYLLSFMPLKNRLSYKRRYHYISGYLEFDMKSFSSLNQ
jgi:glycosyltransferase involved in cell wall biosynthesis